MTASFNIIEVCRQIFLLFCAKKIVLPFCGKKVDSKNGKNSKNYSVYVPVILVKFQPTCYLLRVLAAYFVGLALYSKNLAHCSACLCLVVYVLCTTIQTPKVSISENFVSAKRSSLSHESIDNLCFLKSLYDQKS